MAVCCATRDLELSELRLRSKPFGPVHSGAILYTLARRGAHGHAHHSALWPTWVFGSLYRDIIFAQNAKITVLKKLSFLIYNTCMRRVFSVTVCNDQNVKCEVVICEHNFSYSDSTG